eukprot:scaffold217307_cov23-Tisochrysis_lutea.AAC.1
MSGGVGLHLETSQTENEGAGWTTVRGEEAQAFVVWDIVSPHRIPHRGNSKGSWTSSERQPIRAMTSFCYPAVQTEH